MLPMVAKPEMHQASAAGVIIQASLQIGEADTRIAQRGKGNGQQYDFVQVESGSMERRSTGGEPAMAIRRLLPFLRSLAPGDGGNPA